MAQVSTISKAYMIAFVVAMFSAVAVINVSAQGSEMAPAPAPMDAGAALSLPVSGVAIGFGLIVSLLALLNQH